MTTMNISLPEEMKAFVDAQTAKQGCASVDEYLRTLIREEQKRQAKRKLDDMLLEALDGGPGEIMTREDWKAIEREALERLAEEQRRS